MFAWLIARARSAREAALAAYGGRRRRTPLLIAAAGLRALAFTLLTLLAANAIVGARHAARPLVALDASASWTRGRDSTAFRDAARAARAPGRGLARRLRGLPPARRPRRLARRIAPHACVRSPSGRMAAGRPLVVFTDGEIDDADALAQLPTGSRIVLGGESSRRDAAVLGHPRPARRGGGGHRGRPGHRRRRCWRGRRGGGLSTRTRRARRGVG